ncbi:MAG: acetyl-CoA carboxylase biotin carboxylase subunit [Saprospiraceae bacterium]|nr:acetyl-CoA carboxylase biotin carboxylase subunit [Saprospiraceae bacterium]
MKKILVANRGEIALRIMKTARKMGIKTVAVYSDVDRHSPHVKYADEAIHLGGNASSESYLVIDKIIAATKKSGADAIHPGYGFLSENAAFAERIQEENLIFIGPNVHAITVMGSKLAAKEAVKGYDIPMVPGIDEAIEDVNLAKEIASKIGFPILIKASAGGGGKGMRVVKNIDELPEQMNRAISEAQSAFGDGSVFIEKYVASPRHIEIQILADTHGNTVHLFERECSIQRRHQKVVEEAPSSVLDTALRSKMGEAAIKVAEACQYVGAGTVEFLLDENNNFYFLEMNTRLQVEHPVTELITGIDLVEQQINVAKGLPLSFKQEDLTINGHALELRIYAEDPLNNFLPNIGSLEKYTRPKGDGIRLDDGYEEGMEIPIFYDPMLAKLISYGKDRNAAIQKMKEAIAQYQIEGIKTTLSFGEFVCNHPNFISGDFDTHFVQKYFTPEALNKQTDHEKTIAAQLALRVYLENEKQLKVANNQSDEWLQSRMQ